MALQQNDLHFLRIAQITGQKSKFSRHRRGAVLVSNNKIIAQGVNSHLDQDKADAQVAQIQDTERYVATVNAEMVAIGEAIKSNASLLNTTMYVSDAPNWITFKNMVILGIKRIVHYGPISSERMQHYAKELNITLIGVG